MNLKKHYVRWKTFIMLCRELLIYILFSYRWQGVEQFVPVHKFTAGNTGASTDFEHIVIDGNHYLAQANPDGIRSKLFNIITYWSDGVSPFSVIRRCGGLYSQAQSRGKCLCLRLVRIVLSKEKKRRRTSVQSRHQSSIIFNTQTSFWQYLWFISRFVSSFTSYAISLLLFLVSASSCDTLSRTFFRRAGSWPFWYNIFFLWGCFLF